MPQKKWVRWGLVEAATIATIVSCGQVSDKSDADAADDAGTGGLSTGGASTGGATGSVGGAVASGGASSSGGGIFIGSGGSEPPGSLGGANSEWCPNIPAGIVEPPCTEDDLIVPSECNYDAWISFVFPAVELGLSYPTAELNLWLTAPTDPVLGQGGAPSMMAAEPLNVWFTSQQGGTVTGTGFVINDARALVHSQIAPDLASMAEYFSEVQDPESDGSYYITQMVLTEGTLRLSERRVVFEPSLVCRFK